MPVYLPQPPGNPLSRLLAAVAAALLLALAFFFGLVVLAVVAGLVLVAWLLLTVRVWWLKRQAPFPTGSRVGQPGRKPSGPGQVLEGDYEVVSRSDDEDGRNRARE